MRLPARGNECERPSAGARRDHRAASQFDDAIEYALALSAIVQDDQRGTAGSTSFPDDFIHQFDALRVEVVVWLVKEQQARRSHNQPRQRESALHPRGKTAHSLVSRLPETHALQDWLNPRFADPKHSCCKLQIFDGRQVVVEAGGMRQESDVTANLDGVAHQMVTANPSLASRGAQSRGNNAQQGALAATVMSNNPNDFAQFEFERNATQRPSRSESSGESLEL